VINNSLYDFRVHRSTLDARFFKTCLKQNLLLKTVKKIKLASVALSLALTNLEAKQHYKSVQMMEHKTVKTKLFLFLDISLHVCIAT
jgi:hypothetical protein